MGKEAIRLARVGGVMGLAGWAALLLAQPPGSVKPESKDDKKDPQSKFEPKSAPGIGQKFLARMEGDWTVEKTFFARSADAPPVKSKGTCKQEMVQGGRFLRSDFTFEGAEGPTTGTGVIGYEPGPGLFTSTWFDSRQTKMSIRRSAEKFDGEKIVLLGVSLGDAKDTRKSKTITTLEEGGKRIVHKQYSIAADGSERIIMQLEMTKKGP